MAWRIMRAASRPRMPWRNGGGETTDVATWPRNAGLDDFEWRVSLAHMARDATFSHFPGVERVTSVVDGDGLDLQVGDDPSVCLTTGSSPFRFSGEVPCVGRLRGGPVLNLNAMVRRDRFRVTARRVHASGSLAVASAGAVVIVVCTEGTWDLRGEVLSRHDALVIGEAAGCVVEARTSTSSAVEIRLSPS